MPRRIVACICCGAASRLAHFASVLPQLPPSYTSLPAPHSWPAAPGRLSGTLPQTASSGLHMPPPASAHIEAVSTLAALQTHKCIAALF
eukprot:365661-Chlamydomonas_euryale.AAC.8